MRVFLWSLLLSIPFLISGCKGGNDPSTLIISVKNISGGNEVVADGQMKYRNKLGQYFGIQGLRYFISNMYLLDDKGQKIALDGYHLVDQKNSSSLQFSLETSTRAHIMKVGFMIGIDAQENNSASQRAAIDPDNLMYWPWLGYRFFVLDGSFRKDSINEGYTFHLGTDIARKIYEQPVHFDLKGGVLNFDLVCNLDEFFTNPHDINLLNDNYTHSDPGIPAEVALCKKLSENMSDMFTINQK